LLEFPERNCMLYFVGYIREPGQLDNAKVQCFMFERRTQPATTP